MIPGGMPSGVPASVYRTPMDALNHQQVNRAIMSSVYGNAIQYSPELFAPVESAYYTAPNTCMRVRPPNWSTEATPGNSQSQNGLSLSQNRNAADSGTGSGNPSGNSRSQREQLGGGQASTSSPTPRSAETRSRKSVRYASLDDDGLVILFVSSDSDVPDAPVKIQVSANKQFESSENKGDKSAKKNKDENSANGKSAEQSETTRKSSKKQAVSSEKVSKKERGRSANKKRHRRSRSSSESRSPSSDKGHKGGRDRSEKSSAALSSSSRKKSQRQVPNGDKVVPATSSDDSSSESENDESPRTNIESRSMHVLNRLSLMARHHLKLFGRSFRIVRLITSGHEHRSSYF